MPGFSTPDSERISSCFDSVESSAEDLSVFASFRFFPSRSDEGAGSIGRGRVFEGLSMCI